MERLSLCCFFLMITSSTITATDLDSSVILFPKESITSYVILRPKVKSSLTSFTICLNYYTDLTRAYSLLSIANPGKFNDILIFREDASTYKVFVGDEEMLFTFAQDTLGWRHLCISWDSSSGVVTLWINGKPLPRKTMKKGYTVDAQPIIILGQEQDSYGGSFDVKQSFVGEIADVQMWDYSLPPNDIYLALANCNFIRGNVFNWRSLDYDIKGDAIIQPKLLHNTVREGCQLPSPPLDETVG